MAGYGAGQLVIVVQEVRSVITRNRAALETISETSTIKAVLLSHPVVLRVILDREIPASCAYGTIADAARACGLTPGNLLAEIRAALDQAEVGHQATRG